MFRKFIILTSFIVFANFFAQKTHTVSKGDNPYNIAKKYGMTLDELVKMNPNLKDGKIAIGDVLKINGKSKPVKADAPKTNSETPKEVQPSKNMKTGKIILQPKQTIYGITKQYHISETDLRKLNPSIDSGMKIGDEIVLPLENMKKYGANQSNAVAEKPEPSEVKNNELPKEQEAPSDGIHYTIQQKDNYYRITKKFGLTQKQLFDLNPGLEQKGLQPGEVIFVKDSGENKPQENKVIVSSSISKDDFMTYTVQDGDTVFGIINKFGISLDELLSLNPDLSGGLKAGMVLKIKKVQKQYAKKEGDALNVVLMLPFGFDTNETKYRNMALDFLTGAKLSLERNAAEGQKLNVRVIDSGNEKDFKNSLKKLDRDNTDLIIGPFLKSNVLEVLDYVKSQKIPVVAPFANADELYDYDNLIIIETNDKVYADRIVKEIKETYSDQKIYIVTGAGSAQGNYIKENLAQALKNPTIVLTSSASDIQLDQNMMTGQAAPIIAVLATDNDETGAAFANKLVELSKQTAGMKAFSMYYHPEFEKKTDELSQAHLVYLMDRKINTDGEFEKEILKDYKQKYCKSPGKYSVIGFDVVNDMLTRENGKGEIFKQISKVQTQLATKFEFMKAKPNGAYINTGYRVVRLLP